MSERIITDIRLFKSEGRTESGHFDMVSFGDKRSIAAVKRIVMKLRENGFSMGDFDHLYINFTLCELSAPMELSQEVDRYHPWFRHCHVRVPREVYESLGTPDSHGHIISIIGEVLTAFFASDNFDADRIRNCIQEAVTGGEGMLMFFKEKTTAKRRAVIYLRFLDSCRYAPLLRVYDGAGDLLLERDLPQMVTLDALGELQVGLKKVTVKPRKNTLAAGKKPLVFEY